MKFKLVLLSMVLICHTAYAADQWDKTKPAGSQQAADIDSIIQVNNSAVDRMLANYRAGAYGYSTGSANGFSVSAGDLAISNASGSVRRYRSNPSATSVTWSNMDTGGGDANSTTYYYYAVADTDADTWTVMISASSTAPTGATYYRKLGAFYNNSAGSIEIGGIIEMFSGHTLNIPPGYVLCNGSNGTPDLRNLFIIGAGDKAASGDTNSAPSNNTLTGTGTALHYDSPNGTDRGDSGAATPRVLYEDNGTPGNGTNLIMPYYALAYIMRQGVE